MNSRLIKINTTLIRALKEAYKTNSIKYDIKQLQSKSESNIDLLDNIERISKMLVYPQYGYLKKKST